uniref:Androgen induced 1 n=1 Tax=Equus caballus TaxID=9796 RepID=A0A9L0SA66_HORSE
MALVPCQVLRAAILLSYCSILCNYKAIEMPSHQTYGGSWKFLTFIDLWPRSSTFAATRRYLIAGARVEVGCAQVVGCLEGDTDLLLRDDAERFSTWQMDWTTLVMSGLIPIRPKTLSRTPAVGSSCSH